VREDPVNASLLFAGTEFGAYVSFDRGEHWSLLASNLPTVRVDDIQIHPRERDLILGTHGRSIWILDDLTPLEQLAPARSTELTLFDIRPATSWRMFGPTNAQQGTGLFAAPNPPEGALVSFFLKSPAEKVRVTITDRDGTEVAAFDAKGQAGVNRVNWDLRLPAPVPPTTEDRWATSEGFFSGFIHPPGPFVEPGEYSVKVEAGSHRATKTVRVDDDPSITITAQDRARRHEALMKAYELYKTSVEEARTVRDLRANLTEIMDVWKDKKSPAIPDAIRTQAEAFSRTLDDVSPLFVPRQGGSGGNFIYTPPPMPARLATALYNFQSYTAPPRKQDLDKLAELTGVAREASARLKRVIDFDLAQLNKAINDAGIPRITTSRKP
jgi:hypothetical protein